MKEFIDKTDVENGTAINRANMMAVQGFEGKKIVFNSDGSITETNDNGETLTTTFSNIGVIETFVGEKTITKTTAFNSYNLITEVLS